VKNVREMPIKRDIISIMQKEGLDHKSILKLTIQN